MLETRVEVAGAVRRRLPRRLLPAGRQRPLRRRRARGLPPRQVVRPRTRPALPRARPLHRRRHFSVRQPGRRDEVPRAVRQQGARLRGGVGLGHRARRVFVHRAPPLRRHLQAGRRAGPGLRVPLLGPGDQRARHHSHGARPGARDWHRARSGRGRLQRRHRSRHARHLPPRGNRQDRGREGPARCRPRASARAGQPVLRVDGRHPGLRQLGRPPGRGRGVATGLLREVAPHRRPGPRLRLHGGRLDPPPLVEGRARGRRHGRGGPRGAGPALRRFTVRCSPPRSSPPRTPGEGGQWFAATWEFTKQILPLLLFGVLVADRCWGVQDRKASFPPNGSAAPWAATPLARTSSHRLLARSCTSPHSPRCPSSRA